MFNYNIIYIIYVVGDNICYTLTTVGRIVPVAACDRSVHVFEHRLDKILGLAYFYRGWITNVEYGCKWEIQKHVSLKVD